MTEQKQNNNNKATCPIKMMNPDAWTELTCIGPRCAWFIPLRNGGACAQGIVVVPPTPQSNRIAQP